MIDDNIAMRRLLAVRSRSVCKEYSCWIAIPDLPLSGFTPKELGALSKQRFSDLHHNHIPGDTTLGARKYHKTTLLYHICPVNALAGHDIWRSNTWEHDRFPETPTTRLAVSRTSAEHIRPPPGDTSTFKYISLDHNWSGEFSRLNRFLFFRALKKPRRRVGWIKVPDDPHTANFLLDFAASTCELVATEPKLLQFGKRSQHRWNEACKQQVGTWQTD